MVQVQVQVRVVVQCGLSRPPTSELRTRWRATLGSNVKGEDVYLRRRGHAMGGSYRLCDPASVYAAPLTSMDKVRKLE